MRKSDQTLEPSIEEILASIRKIIADDGSQSRESDTGPFAGAAERPRQPQPASLPRFLDPHAYEPAEPAEPAGDEEIMELTEDIILEDQSSQDNRDPNEFTDQTTDPFATAAAGGEVEADIGRHSVNAQLENIFSNVAAEVERLSHGQTPMAESGAAAAETDDWDGPNQVRQAVETYNAAVSSRAQSRAPEELKPGKTSAPPAPTPEARHEPAEPAPRPVASPLTSRPQSRQVWSARHLEGEGPRSRRGKDEDESPAVSQRGEPPARAAMSGARDSWAEGVQMPVPESGPTVPFASAPDDDLIPEPVAPKAAASGPAADLEKEKDYVGGVLTRVFGRSQKKSDEPPPPAASAPAPASKAEKLAKATISDFAAEKLRAPVVADALQADKPFMETITDSLETALANVEMGVPDAAEPTESPKDTPAMEAQPAPYDELLPDALLPFDSELAPFAAGQVPGSSSQEKAPAPRGKAPELPIESGKPKSGLFRDDADASVAAPSGQPLPAPAAVPALSQSALPSGLEDSIKELIKPLIIEWLNNNLPRIVEKAVREELADHGGLAGLRREGGVRR